MTITPKVVGVLDVIKNGSVMPLLFQFYFSFLSNNTSSTGTLLSCHQKILSLETLDY
jgi:hypothetical protein